MSVETLRWVEERIQRLRSEIERLEVELNRLTSVLQEGTNRRQRLLGAILELQDIAKGDGPCSPDGALVGGD